MQPRILKHEKLALRVWRALALIFTASALTLSLGKKPPKARAVSSPSAPIEATRRRPDAEETREAISAGYALGASGDADALEALIAIAERGEPKSSRATLDGIAQIGGDRARQFLAQRFSQAAAAELPALASALATLGDAPARALLQSAARSAGVATRGAALAALATLDTPDVREYMLLALDDADPSAAAAYFADCREPRALPALERLARDGNPALRRTAIDALLAQGVAAQPALVRLLSEDDELCDALLEGQPRTVEARQALRKASVARLREGALTGGRVFDFLQRDLSRDAREALLQAARDAASSESAMNALSARGDGESLRALSTLANDGDAGLAQRAACALFTQPDSRSLPFLLRLPRADSKSQAGAALVHINARAARPI